MKKLVCCLALSAALLSLPALAGELTLRGCWVSTVYNLDYPSAAGLSAERLAAEADAIIARARADGMNALFLQVRPCADALYPSAIYPWSSYLTGEQGRGPGGGFDPLGYFVEQCHENGLQLHAWINPYRVTRQAAGSLEDALAQLCADHPVRALTDCLLLADDGCLYLDPGRPESRALIEDGVRELLENYDLDGVHMDDYFYPSAGFDDRATVAAFGESYADPAAFRRASVDTLVAGLHDLCRGLRPTAQFGISPFGIWANAHQTPEGSATRGGSSYFDHCADSRKWVREELVDYIMPQLYWAIGADEGEFSALLSWWRETVRGTRVRLYVGLAAYRAADAAADSVWYDGAQVLRQLDALEADELAAGAVLFRYGSLASVPAMEEAVAARFIAQRDKYRFPRDTVTVGLSLTSPVRAQYPAAGEPVTVTVAAAPGSRVTVWSDGISTALSPRADGAYAGAVTPPGPEPGAEARPSALLCTAERDGFVWVKLFDFTVTPVACGEPQVVTDVAGADDENGHLVQWRTDAPCAAALDLSGDVLRVTLRPVKTAALFEDRFFTDLRVHTENGLCTYELALPGSGQDWLCALEWQPGLITLRLTRRQS